MLARLLLLFAGHALCDYPLQGDFLAKAKNHKLNPHGWPRDLIAHTLIHAGMVFLITRSLWFALAELVIHTVTDYAKCDGRISSNVDQAIHYACKVLWAVL
jgi:hypothetical protein